MDRFAASLYPEAHPPEATTHPRRLYGLLCQAARLYVDANTASLVTNPVLPQSFPSAFGQLDFTQFDADAGGVANMASVPGGSQVYGLSNWLYENQQLMGLLDEDVMF